jgi:uncharacterized DUF497 family protein
VEFRWNEWNIDHIAEHGVRPDEAETVVRNAKRPYPMRHVDDKWLVRGRGLGGRLIQVIFLIDNDEDETIYVIHARPLTDKEKRKFRKGE